ncbi:1-pyrroline-5-carboxylate dehydrogenase [Deinobacterium chartae]|uniref:L-glutamate gamma-semialdehyde dehydrogenase n=1 Tax=Deinobacterium chartae TaxID=521158 RepID=A0A841I289_9DEIO|nr:L-glutamate gamma-semialdehyde dehydrogenase [Deinobacterium chartae]MBB6098458.1 1-pyrroline-5-carboxylate dehydrogenase [Deinobacterium chartae]
MQTTLEGFLPFQHEPYFDYSNLEIAERQRAAFARIREQGPQNYPLIIGGERVFLEDSFEVRNPADPREVVGRFPKARGEHLEAAIRAAEEAYATWQHSDPLQRAAILMRAGQIFRARRMELNAYMSLENGKNWVEADGEVAESVDHCEFFAREAVRWAAGKSVSPLSYEHVTMTYEPIGVVAVISPWNFPSAIPIGMAFGAIAAGNTVVLKPASESPISAYLFCEIMEQAGLPKGVLNLLTGEDSEMGDPLVDHPRVRMVAFTGSREIGCRIYERAAKVQPGQIWLKRVMAEMGGKDATVVCADADLEAAAQGIVAAAFGYSGQKCSACSRAIIEDSVYDQVLDRVVELSRKLVVGLPEDNADVGPVIHADSARRILEYIEEGKRTAKLVLGGERAEVRAADGTVLEGGFIQPTIFSEVDRSSKLFREEIFGPVLAVTRARDWKHALELANDSEYGLTGAFYSKDPEKIAYARRHFHVGNLYVNRKCTGAMSGTHSFGGYNMSGTGAKVGGPDYLFYFLQAKTTAQKY